MLQLQVDRMFQMQKELDQRIEHEHGLKKEQLIQEKTLALAVEIGELANETRCFKFWSVKPPSDEKIILEEYVDGLHFILSIGITKGYYQEIIKGAEQEKGLVERFSEVYDAISAFRRDESIQRFETLFSAYVSLGGELGFSSEDIESAYDDKNKVNHTRQDTGY